MFNESIKGGKSRNSSIGISTLKLTYTEFNRMVKFMKTKGLRSGKEKSKSKIKERSNPKILL
jgi:hypothetical protein